MLDEIETYHRQYGADNFPFQDLTAILKRAASGTSVSVLGSSWKGEGSMYQAYFYPEKVEGLLKVDPMELEVGYGLIRVVDPSQGGSLANIAAGSVAANPALRKDGRFLVGYVGVMGNAKPVDSLSVSKLVNTLMK